jgi:hypothetical protein
MDWALVHKDGYLWGGRSGRVQCGHEEESQNYRCSTSSQPRCGSTLCWPREDSTSRS